MGSKERGWWFMKIYRHSNRNFSQWNEIFDDPVIAILDYAPEARVCLLLFAISEPE
jgi:hypothetical protein